MAKNSVPNFLNGTLLVRPFISPESTHQRQAATIADLTGRNLLETLEQPSISYTTGASP